MADNEAELHRFAMSLGLHRLSYQGPPKTSAPHYDITAFERDRAIRLGALACRREQIVEVYRRVRVNSKRRPATAPSSRQSTAPGHAAARANSE
jgi:hypothetical protein